MSEQPCEHCEAYKAEIETIRELWERGAEDAARRNQALREELRQVRAELRRERELRYG